MTQLLVLGALNMQPMSGYDIQNMLQENEAERWSGVLVGSIYHALKKLEQNNFIEIDRIEHSGNRQKSIYKITELGKEHLKDLVYNSIISSDVPYPLSFYAGLSFIEQLDVERAIEALRHQLTMLERELVIVESGISIKEKHLSTGLSPLMSIVSNNMVNIIKQQINFVKDLLKNYNCN
ncbi:PadR family transcriptional regulator [Solibacillus daqui]|uniref:PadR family transcriptional regulator n=1 Tax=Solibacillus daqui TaxID=2912187 RepID=UPI002365DBBF|nr:PadR family transcriptional regulator [Solibacillus daqui]